MKVIISYPPLGEKRCPTLGQNRQFQWFHNPSFIYPMVPAWAATMLEKCGHEVIWNDAIAMGWSEDKFWDFLKEVKPEMIAFETKTPVVKRHWEIIRRLKAEYPDSLVVLFGDHVTALPEESLNNSPVDFVLTGGDYDFLLANLVEHLEKGKELEPGIWFRKKGEIVSTGQFSLNHDLDALPEINRDLTCWHLYGEHLFIKSPHTYTMAGRDCWYGKCTFCSWTTLYPRYRVRKCERVLDEIGNLIKRYGVREIFDDTGTFPAGRWLENFCAGIIERGYHEQVAISCNARVGAISEEQFKMMKKAGFRLLKFGLESANQKTLDRLNKGIKVSDIIESCRLAKKAGLTVHLTTMVGYPWESLEEAKKTVRLSRKLLSDGHADMLQATIIIPYPGTPLFEEAKKEGWLKTEDWNEYDMRGPVMTTPVPEEQVKKLTRVLYTAFLTPRFIGRTVFSIRSADDFRFVMKAGKAVLGHLRDFALRRKNASEC